MSEILGRRGMISFPLSLLRHETLAGAMNEHGKHTLDM